MSKTYKHQAKYDQKKYWSNYRGYGWNQPIVENNKIVGWLRMPPAPRTEKEPHPWYWHGIDTKSKQSVEKILQKRFRHKVKSLIKKGEYDLLPLKPEDSCWILW